MMSAVTLTQSGAMRVHDLMALENNPALMLRVWISGGGCSGFRYNFGFDTQLKPHDAIIEHPFKPDFIESARFNDVKIVVDPLSLMYLQGAEIDYVSSLQGEYFAVKNNPNAQTTCSCGSSFAIT